MGLAPGAPAMLETASSRNDSRIRFDRLFCHSAITLHGADPTGFTGQHSAGIRNELRAEFKSGALKALPTDDVLQDRAVEAYETVQRGAPKREVLILR